MVEIRPKTARRPIVSACNCHGWRFGPRDIGLLRINSARGKVRVGLGRGIGCGRCEKANCTESRAIVVDPRPQLEEPIIA